MEETYVVLSSVDAKGRAKVRRVSDGMVAYCKLDWLTMRNETEWVAVSRTKDLRMGNLEWAMEA